jgi:ATP-dependent protease HslVU (ClpYQ) peptidase subunit
MTTIIVTEDNKMYADSQSTMGNFISSEDEVKIENINGFLVGAAGRWSSCLAFREWFASTQDIVEAAKSFPTAAEHMVYPTPDNKDDDFQFNALVLDPEGVLTLFEGNFAAYVVEKPFAIGTGGEYALCALDAGASGEEALAVAMKRDVYTGGSIHFLSLDSEDEELSEEGVESDD